MVKIQLENGYLDVKEGTVFPLNYGVADIRDLQSRSGIFSKTITLSGTKNNHNLLNHYYDVNTVAGTFDINALTSCAVIVDGEVLIEDALIQLVSVNKVQKTDAHEESIEYSVLIKDLQADFFSKIDQNELTALDFSEFNHIYNSTNVIASFNNTVTDGYVYPLGLSPDNNYQLIEFKPAIYAKQYWDKIHQAVGFTYDWSTLSDCNFDKLVIPYNGDLQLFDFSDYLVDAENVTNHSFTQPVGVNVTSTSGNLNFWTENQDLQGLFNPTTGQYDVPFYVNAGQAIYASVDLTMELKLVNGTGSTAYLVDLFSIGNTEYNYRIQVQIYKNGVFHTASPYNASPFNGADYTRGLGSLPNGTTSLGTETRSFIIPCSNLLPTDILTYRVKLWVEETSNLRWKASNSVLGTNVQIDLALDTDIKTKMLPSADILESGATVQMNDFVPKQIKQKDFIKSICQMFNLYPEPSVDNPNEIVYQHRDDYYDSGIAKDWTYKLAKDEEQILQFLPEVTAKKLILSYKDDKDEPNQVYKDSLNETYGQVEYTFDNEYIRGTQRKDLIFSPTPMTNTVFDAIVPMMAMGAPKVNLRILQHNGQGTCSPYNIYDYLSNGTFGVTDYPIVSHFDNHLNPTFDINFGICDYYYYDGITVTNNNLFNLYWRRTIGQINNGKMLTAYFDLQPSDIAVLRLNDKIRIDNSWWHINKVLDYDANSDSLTKVELLSVDEEIDLPNFRIRFPFNYTNPKPIKGIIRDIISRANVNLSPESTTVTGFGNVIPQGIKGRVDGEYKTVDRDGLWVDLINGYTTDELNGNFANTDLTFDGNRSHDTNGFDLNISTDGGNNAESNILLSTTSANWQFGSKGVLVSSDGTFIKGAKVNSYISANGTITLNNANYLVNCTDNTFTVNLPTAVGIQGREYVIKNSGSGVITVDPNGIETIDRNTTVTLIQYESITVVSNGSNWIITAKV